MEKESPSLSQMLPKPQWPTPPTTPPDAPSSAVVQACVSAAKGVVLRADAAKDSANPIRFKVG